MRNTLVPQTGQTPRVAGLLFLSTIACGFLISLFVLHFIQYACIVNLLSYLGEYQTDSYLSIGIKAKIDKISYRLALLPFIAAT